MWGTLSARLGCEPCVAGRLGFEPRVAYLGHRLIVTVCVPCLLERDSSPVWHGVPAVPGRVRPTASISSMKTMHGAFFLACETRS